MNQVSLISPKPKSWKRIEIFDSENSVQEIILKSSKTENEQKTERKNHQKFIHKTDQQLQLIVDDFYETLLIEKDSFDS
jgi:hypothetical protein